MNKLIERLREPSTWAGFGVIAAIIGVPTTTYQLLQQAGMAVAGLAAIFLAEKK